MGKITTVTLDDAAAAFLDAQVAAGHFASTDAALTAAVHLLAAQDKALEELRAEIRKGEESGWIEGFNMQEWIAQKRKDYAA